MVGDLDRPGARRVRPPSSPSRPAWSARRWPPRGREHRRDPGRPAHLPAAAGRRPTAICCGRSARPRRWRRWPAPSRPSSSARASWSSRIDLAREIHEGVIQRLFGVSMALDGDGALPADAGAHGGARPRPRRRSPSCAPHCSARSAAHPPGHPDDPHRRGGSALARVHPAISGLSPGPGGSAGDVPGRPRAAGPVGPDRGRAQRPQARVSRRASACGWAGPTARSGSRSSTTGSSAPARRSAGMGLRLAAAGGICSSNGVVEFGEREPGRWQVRLVVPDRG